MFIIIAILNLIIGTLIGISGIGGFFLPIVYTSILGYEVKESLQISFTTFIVSGIMGTVGYSRQALIDWPLAIRLGISCFIGAIIGVWISGYLPITIMRILLFSSVFISGLILISGSRTDIIRKPMLNNNVFMIILGLATGVVCSITGAGGALFLIPILATLGMEIHKTVGVGIFASVFVAIPPSVGYSMQTKMNNRGTILIVALASHSIGVYIGTRIARLFQQPRLKWGVGFLSIISSSILFLITMISEYFA